MAGQTPSQTVGPFFAYGLTAEQYGYDFAQTVRADLLADCPQTKGERIRIMGRVFDGEGAPITDAMVEIWQRDGEGRTPAQARKSGSNTNFSGIGRCGTGTRGDCCFVFDTIKPGAPDAHFAPHVDVVVFARGLLTHVFTRAYFADEVQANARDPVLALVPDARRHTLLAERQDDHTGPPIYRFDIHMQGAYETVFFDL